jgi:hypothetical protein
MFERIPVIDSWGRRIGDFIPSGDYGCVAGLLLMVVVVGLVIVTSPIWLPIMAIYYHVEGEHEKAAICWVLTMVVYLFLFVVIAEEVSQYQMFLSDVSRIEELVNIEIIYDYDDGDISFHRHPIGEATWDDVRIPSDAEVTLTLIGGIEITASCHVPWGSAYTECEAPRHLHPTSGCVPVCPRYYVDVFGFHAVDVVERCVTVCVPVVPPHTH